MIVGLDSRRCGIDREYILVQRSVGLGFDWF